LPDANHNAKLNLCMLYAFRRQVADCGEPFTRSDALAVGDSVRRLTRSHGLNPGVAAEEFYKLALESGLDADDARVIRDKVKKLRCLMGLLLGG
jgi:hypothetical protein